MKNFKEKVIFIGLLCLPIGVLIIDLSVFVNVITLFKYFDFCAITAIIGGIISIIGTIFSFCFMNGV